MLSKEDKQKIRRLQSYHCSIKEVKGKPVTDDGKPFIIPSYPELLAKAIADIEELGFAKRRAHISQQTTKLSIVRVFSTEHHKYNTELTYNLFGTIFYTKSNLTWTAEFGCNTMDIRYDRFKSIRWLCQDEQVIFTHDFADFYLHIG